MNRNLDKVELLTYVRWKGNSKTIEVLTLPPYGQKVVFLPFYVIVGTNYKRKVELYWI